MNRVTGNPSKPVEGPRATEAKVSPPQNSQVENYLEKLDSQVGEVEGSLAELRRRLSPLLMPEQDSHPSEQLGSIPAVMSEATYHIHRLTERLEVLRGSIGDILSRL